MKKFTLIFSVILLTLSSKAQTGYDIRLDLMNYKDTIAYLGKYVFDQTYIQDTCRKVKNGKIEFKGKKSLDKGVYIVVTQDKSFLFDFLVNESQKILISADLQDLGATLNAPGNKENQLLFSYLKYTASKNQEFNDARLSTVGKSREDSAKIMRQKISELDASVKNFDKEYMEMTKGTFVHDLMNLKIEKMATDVPKAKNGRPDSVYQYYYYKNHYFDGIDLNDERISRTPYFDDRVKKYFDNVIVNAPDTVIKEIDRLLARSTPGNLNYNALVSYFTYKYEQAKQVGFDKVFLHMVDNYILAGKTKDLYSEGTMKNLAERSRIMNPLLEGKVAEDLYMIDTTNAPRVKKMGFDTARTSQGATTLYYKNERALRDMFVRMHDVEAKYTVLVFWAADCGHCQKEIPKLNENLKQIKGKIDVKVYAVQIKDDLYNDWKKFLIDNKISEFINVYDPVHINNVKEKFDVNSTPMIYILDKDKKILTKKIGAEFVVEYLKAAEKQEKERKP